MSRRTITESLSIYFAQLTVLILFRVSDALDTVLRVLPARDRPYMDVDLSAVVDSNGTSLTVGDRVSRNFDGRLGTITGESQTGPGVTIAYDGGGGETTPLACGWTKV